MKSRRVYLFIWIFILLALFVFIRKTKEKYHAKFKISADQELISPKEDVAEPGLIQDDFFDLESKDSFNGAATIKEGKAFSGKRSCMLTENDEYGVTYNKKLSDLKNFGNIRSIKYKARFFSDKNLQNVFIVFEVNSPDGKTINWEKLPIKEGKHNWELSESDFIFPSGLLQPNNSFKLYVWNRGKQMFYEDDVEILINGIVYDNVPEQETAAIEEAKQINFHFDFEAASEFGKDGMITTEQAHSGKQSVKTDSRHTYSPAIIKQFKNLTSGILKSVSLSTWFYSSDDDPEIVLVASATDPSGKEYFWTGKDTKKFTFKKNTWYRLNANFNFPEEKNNPENKITTYLWNKKGSAVYVDDFDVVYNEEKDNSKAGPNVVIDPFKEYTYSPVRNKPPFTISYFEKADIGNHDDVFLSENNNVKDGELLPDDKFIAGNFISDPGKTDELIRINQSSVDLFKFCTSENKFAKVWNEKNAGEIGTWNDSYCIGADFNNDGKAEILRISVQNKKINLLSFSEDNNSGKCLSENPKGKWNTLWQSNEGKILDWNFMQEDICLSGSFKGDGKCQLLIINPSSGHWTFLQFLNGAWQYAGGNKDIAKTKVLFSTTSAKISSCDFGRKEILLVNAVHGEQNSVSAFEYNPATQLFSEISLPEKIDSKLFPAKSEIFSGNFTSPTERDILVYNRTWRFDLKTAGLDAKGLFIKNNIDFRGYSGDQNPKYYEILKLIPGNFISSNATSLIAIMRNCGEKSKDGVRCKKYREVKELPSRIQLYTFTVKQ